MKTLLLCLFVWMAVNGPLTAAPITIDFESFADQTELSNQISGISFQNAIVLTAGLSLNEFEFPPHSGQRVIADDLGPLLVSFAIPVSGFGAYFTYISGLRLQALDRSGSLLAEVLSQYNNNTALSGDPGSRPNEFLSLHADAISAVRMVGSGDGGSFTADDLTTGAVPEPTTLTLLLCAGFALAACQYLRSPHPLAQVRLVVHRAIYLGRRESKLVFSIVPSLGEFSKRGVSCRQGCHKLLHTGTKAVASTAIILAVAHICALTLDAAPSIGKVAANPAMIVVNKPTNVYVTAVISDPSLIPGSVNLLQLDDNGSVIANLGSFNDQGIAGDQIAGDHVYTVQAVLRPAQVQTILLRASAAFQGIVRRVESPIATVQVSSGQEITADRKYQILDAISLKFQSRSRIDRDADNRELLAFMQTFPEIEDSGISNDSCVWAQFTDGENLLVANNTDPGLAPASNNNLIREPTKVAETIRTDHLNPTATEQSLASVAGAFQSELPNGKHARVINAMTDLYSDQAASIRQWLTQAGYDVEPNDGSIYSVLSLGGDSVFYYHGHGGRLKGRYTLWTTTRRNRRDDAVFADELRGGLINTVIADTACIGLKIGNRCAGYLQNEEHYGFTGVLIEQRWSKFPDNSFVFLDACGEPDPDNSENVPDWDMAIALRDMNVSVVGGWNAPVLDSTARNTALAVFDRLLGNNLSEAREEGFKQRPFRWSDIAVDLTLHGLDEEPANGARFYFRWLNGNFGLLAPSIGNMSVDEANQKLQLKGIFGSRQGKVTVFPDYPTFDNETSQDLNGTDLQNCTFSTDGSQITCDLPLTGAGSAGHVVVDVDGHKSNVAQLTEWAGQFTHLVNAVGTLQQEVVMNVRFRADIRKWRPQIHVAPVEPQTLAFATKDSYATHQSSGTVTLTSGCESETDWQGSGSLVPGYSGSFDPANLLSAVMNVSDSRNASMVLSFLTLISVTETTSCPEVPTIVEKYKAPLNNYPFDFQEAGTPGSVKVSFSETADIQPRTQGLGGLLGLAAPDILGYGGPGHNLDDTARWALRWNTIQAKYSPDPKSTR